MVKIPGSGWAVWEGLKFFPQIIGKLSPITYVISPKLEHVFLGHFRGGYLIPVRYEYRVQRGVSFPPRFHRNFSLCRIAKKFRFFTRLAIRQAILEDHRTIFLPLHQIYVVLRPKPMIDKFNERSGETIQGFDTRSCIGYKYRRFEFFARPFHGK